MPVDLSALLNQARMFYREEEPPTRHEPYIPMTQTQFDSAINAAWEKGRAFGRIEELNMSRIRATPPTLPLKEGEVDWDGLLQASIERSKLWEKETSNTASKRRSRS